MNEVSGLAGLCLAATLAMSLSAAASETSAQCPRAGTLGTSRELAVDPKTTPRIGLKSFPQTLALNDKEVVLTFDDGPQPFTIHKVLAALAAECVKATFFVVGNNAKAYPELVREEARAGHSIGNHTMTHPMLDRLDLARATGDIDRGAAAIEAALGPSRTVPFFRFPYFASTPDLLSLMERRGVVVFGADLWASDWEPITPEQELKLITSRLEAAGRGIILLHDAQPRTAKMLPAFLAYLKRHNYRVVNVVPAPLAETPPAASTTPSATVSPPPPAPAGPAEPTPASPPAAKPPSGDH